MPGYGIVAEGEGDGLLPWSWATERLAAARNYFISTVRPDGRPHVMVVWGVWFDDAFWFCTSRDSRKARNLAANPRCVICPDDGDEAIIVEGTTAELAAATHGDGAHARFVAAYMAKYKHDMSERGEPIFVVRPVVVFGQIEATYTKSATRWRWDD
jgi:hypothetical protein